LHTHTAVIHGLTHYFSPTYLSAWVILVEWGSEVFLQKRDEHNLDL